MGTEEIQLLVQDSGGLTSSIPLTVTVVRSIAPALINPPQRLGMAAGGQSILSLDELVTDPDDDDTDLLWQVAGQIELHVQLSNSRAVRIEAPGAFNGIEVLTFTVADPSGETASFELLVFSAPANGEPILAPIPDVSVPLDGVDTSLDLDDYVYDLDHEPGQIDWFLPTRADLTLRVDPESHVLTVAPTSDATAGIVDLSLTAIDPDGHEASQTVRIHIVGTGPIANFTIGPIPDVAFAVGEGYDLALDSFVGGDVDASQIQWSVEGAQHLQVELDPESRTARIQAAPDWTGTEELVFVAAGAATVKRRTVRITVRPSGEIGTGPSLGQLPRLTLRAGTFDQSLDLDDFVTGIDPTGLTWAMTTQTENLQVLIDPQSHTVVVLPRADWSGEEQLTLEARDALGTVLTTVLVVEVLQQHLGLELQEIRAPLFAGESEIRLNASEVLAGDTDPGQLTWAATGSQPINVVYDARTGHLVLTGSEPWHASDIITLMARDQNQVESSSHVLLQVYPADGSIGATSPDFQLMIVPNVLQPDYLDLFVVSQITLDRAPLLRLQAGSEGVDLRDRDDGIWHGTHVLQAGQEGNVSFVALGLDDGLNLLKADLTMTVGTVRAKSAKIVARPDVSLEFSARSFAEDAVVAILPGQKEAAGNELVPLSQPVLIHASTPYRSESGQIHMQSVAGSQHPAVYRWDGIRWLFVGATPTDSGIGAPLSSVGLFALMDDLTPPVLREEQIERGELRFRITDDGSGVARPVVSVNAEPVPEHRYRWDGQWLVLDDKTARTSAGLLQISVADRAGNRAAPIERNLGELTGTLPLRFSLGQNYPNPFNPSTVIPLEVTSFSPKVQLQVFNAGGQLVRQLLNEQLAPGIYEITWDARDRNDRNVAAGIYFYRLQVDERFETRKMSLVR